MKQRLVLLSLAVLLLGQLVPASALACAKADDKCKGCDVERTCEKTESGIRCTITAKGETSADAVRTCVRSAAESHQVEGVTVSFEEIDGGIVVTRSANDPELIKKLQSHSGCCQHHQGCCGKAHGHGCPGHGEAAAHTGCPHAKQG